MKPNTFDSGVKKLETKYNVKVITGSYDLITDNGTVLSGLANLKLELNKYQYGKLISFGSQGDMYGVTYTVHGNNIISLTSETLLNVDKLLNYLSR